MATEKELYAKALAKFGDPDKAAAFVASYLEGKTKAPAATKADEPKPEPKPKADEPKKVIDHAAPPAGGPKNGATGGKPPVSSYMPSGPVYGPELAPSPGRSMVVKAGATPRLSMPPVQEKPGPVDYVPGPLSAPAPTGGGRMTADDARTALRKAGYTDDDFKGQPDEKLVKAATALQTR